MYFKKLTTFFLALLILCSNVGLAFNVHYCGGEIASIKSVYSTDEFAIKNVPTQKSCCAEKAKEDESCCKDKVIKLKAKSDVVVKTFTFSIVAPFVFPSDNVVIFPPINVLDKLPTTEYYCDANAPPLFKLYSQFLLYA